MEILKDIEPEGILSMDKRALESFVEDIHNLYWKHYHSERILNRLKKEHEELLWGKENKDEQIIKVRQNSDLCRKQKTVINKIIFVIKSEDRFLTSREIYALLIKYDPDQIRRWLNPPGALTQNLYLAVNDYRRIKSEKIGGNREHYYGLPGFYDEKGHLKEKYREQLYGE